MTQLKNGTVRFFETPAMGASSRCTSGGMGVVGAFLLGKELADDKENNRLFLTTMTWKWSTVFANSELNSKKNVGGPTRTSSVQEQGLPRAREMAGEILTPQRIQQSLRWCVSS